MYNQHLNYQQECNLTHIQVIIYKYYENAVLSSNFSDAKLYRLSCIEHHHIVHNYNTMHSNDYLHKGYLNCNDLCIELCRTLVSACRNPNHRFAPLFYHFTLSAHPFPFM
uniref:Uncharacterized protein n=1 Tax=Opuntia streptacantha TaxID=393608 RepID=A0A7C9A8F9_OPUST